MEIIPIFGNQNNLLTVHYDSEDRDEFSRLFDEWTDIEFLRHFFTENGHDLSQPFWGGVSLNQAILGTRKQAIELRKFLKNLSEKQPDERIKKFISLFKPLDNQQYQFNFLDKKKAYGLQQKSWLRIYALKIGDDMYLITGGAIKLTARMNERNHTKKELGKIDYCKQYLKSEGIIDEDGMVELLEL